MASFIPQWREEGPHGSGSFANLLWCRPARYADIKNIPERTTTGETTTNAPVKKEEKKEAHLPVPSADKASAAASSSKLDLDGNPVYPPAAKPIMQVNIDTGMSTAV